MTTPYTDVSTSKIFDSATGYFDLGDEFDQVRENLANNLPDPKDAFGDDVYGNKAIPNILLGKQSGDQLLIGGRDMITNGGQNLVTTAQSFNNANDTNEGLVGPHRVNP
jgi:hypothetical protein